MLWSCVTHPIERKGSTILVTVYNSTTQLHFSHEHLHFYPPAQLYNYLLPTSTSPLLISTSVLCAHFHFSSAHSTLNQPSSTSPLPNYISLPHLPRPLPPPPHLPIASVSKPPYLPCPTTTSPQRCGPILLQMKNSNIKRLIAAQSSHEGIPPTVNFRMKCVLNEYFKNLRCKGDMSPSKNKRLSANGK
jgi:hypothetical protein